MKSLEMVLKQREELRRELRHYEEARMDIIRPHSGKTFSEMFNELGIEERRVYGRLMKNIRELKIQIDALTYVINYDSVLQDVTAEPEMMSNRERF